MKTTLIISAIAALTLGTGLVNTAEADTATKAAPTAKTTKAPKSNKATPPTKAADAQTSENCPMPHDKRHGHHKMMHDGKSAKDCDCMHKEHHDCMKEHGDHHPDAAPMKDGGMGPAESQGMKPGMEPAPQH